MKNKKKRERCPVCNRMRIDYGFIKNMKLHIKSMAKQELLYRELIDKDHKTLHFDYMKKNLVRYVPSPRIDFKIK